MKMKSVTTVLCAFMCLLCLFGCAAKDGTSATASAGSTTVPEAVVSIKTDYGNISYSKTFEEVVSYKVKQGKNAVQYIFYGVPDGKTKVKVYTLYFADKVPEDKTYYLGTLAADGETKYVYYVPEDDILQEDLSPEENDLICSAQETVNDVIKSVEQLAGFKEEKE